MRRCKIVAEVTLMIESVRRIVNDGQLSAGNASIIDMLCDENLSVAQAAHRLKINPEAVRQQLWRVRMVLSKVMDHVEVKREDYM